MSTTGNTIDSRLIEYPEVTTLGLQAFTNAQVVKDALSQVFMAMGLAGWRGRSLWSICISAVIIALCR